MSHQQLIWGEEETKLYDVGDANYAVRQTAVDRAMSMLPMISELGKTHSVSAGCTPHARCSFPA